MRDIKILLLHVHVRGAKNYNSRAIIVYLLGLDVELLVQEVNNLLTSIPPTALSPVPLIFWDIM